MKWKEIRAYNKIAYGFDTFDKNLLEEWLNGKNISKWAKDLNQDSKKVLQTGKSSNTTKIDNPPYIDHMSYFKSTNPLKVWLVYHPYNNIDEIKDKIEEWTNLRDLKVEFYDSGKSWYYKDTTSMVVITTK